MLETVCRRLECKCTLSWNKEIGEELLTVYGTQTMAVAMVKKWVKCFCEGRKSLDDDEKEEEDWQALAPPPINTFFQRLPKNNERARHSYRNELFVRSFNFTQRA